MYDIQINSKPKQALVHVGFLDDFERTNEIDDRRVPDAPVEYNTILGRKSEDVMTARVNDFFETKDRWGGNY